MLSWKLMLTNFYSMLINNKRHVNKFKQMLINANKYQIMLTKVNKVGKCYQVLTNVKKCLKLLSNVMLANLILKAWHVAMYNF